MPITEFRSAGVYGLEKAPARAAEGLSPAKMGIVGWTDKGPSNYPVQVASIEEFTRAFGGISLRGVVPLEVRAFFGTGGEKAWVSRVVPADAVAAKVSVDPSPGPAKWTFTANGEGTWGNNLKVLIRGNRNFLNRTTNQWDKFDVLVLQPSDFDASIDEAAEVYEQVQFTDSSKFDYLTNVVNDPRKPSLLIKLAVGAAGTPSGLLSVTVPSESIGTGGGSPLAKRFTATLANVPLLDNTLVIKAVSGTISNKTLAPTLGSINGTTTAFNFQAPLSDLPVVEGSLKAFYQRLGVTNELLPPSSGAIDGSNKTFTFEAGVVNNPVHRETSTFKLKYAATASASPQTIATMSVLTLTLASATGFAVGDFINSGGPSIRAKITALAGTAVTAQVIVGTWPASGPITSETSSTSTTFTGGAVTATAGTLDLAFMSLTDTPVHPGTLSISVNVSGVGLATITDNAAGVLSASGGALPLGGTINYTTGVMAGTTATLVAGSTVVATYNMSNVITKQAQVNLYFAGGITGTPVVGETVTVGAANGKVTRVGTANVDVNVTSGTFAGGSATFATSSATGTVTLVTNNNLAQDVALIGSVDGTGVNQIDLVNSETTPTTSGAISVKTNVAPLAGTGIYLDYVALGIVTSSVAGVLSGDVAAGGTANFDTGQVVATFSNPPLNGSTVEFSYQQGQLVRDNGLGKLIGDVDAAGTNKVDYALGTIDVTFATAPPSGTPITASYVKLANAIQYQMTGGSDGSAVSRNDISNPSLAAEKKGIYALDKVEEPLNLVVPDFEGSEFVQADIVDFCDARQNRFAILAMANGTTVDEALQYVLVTQAFDSRNAAMYYPNVYFLNDLTGVPELIPCSGFVAGVYAKTARNKNIGKSPGGIVDGLLDANGTVGPEITLSLADRDRLYQARINPLMSSAATGFVVWGVRTLSRDVRWRYVNARLLHNFLMHRLALQLQWTVFENNGPALWVKITTALEGYLGSLFRLGYFAGESKDQAYFVKCDARNNNQATIDKGQVLIDVGFSPNKPAEFVIFTLQQPTSQTAA